MDSPPSHQPFASVFRPDFEVVTERRGKTTLFPHTQQLPLLHRALTLEFRNALPGYLARVDKRGGGFHKHLLKQAAVMFCNLAHAARPDGLLLQPLTDVDLVTHIAVVQQITTETRRGPLHRFKFYGGESFQPEVRLSGWRVAFTDHILQRFTTRVPNRVGEHLSFLLLAFFESPIIGLPVNRSTSFVLPYMESLLAFPFDYDEEEDELIFLTCLTVNEINSLGQPIPPLAFNQHYGTHYEVPRIRHWLPTKQMIELHAKWERKVALPPPKPPLPPRANWHWMAQRVKDSQMQAGHGPGTTFAFLDRIPGPYTVHYLPGVPEPHVDERQVHKDIPPPINWDARFDQRDHFVRTMQNLK
jgi:hypothetical protein